MLSALLGFDAARLATEVVVLSCSQGNLWSSDGMPPWKTPPTAVAARYLGTRVPFEGEDRDVIFGVAVGQGGQDIG